MRCQRPETRKLLVAFAADNPAKAAPWVRIAQIRFGQSDYSLAIQAAEEALKRDPSNRQAKSVNAVGGLRLAARRSRTFGPIAP